MARIIHLAVIVCLVAVCRGTSPGYSSVPPVPIPAEVSTSSSLLNSSATSDKPDCVCVPYHDCSDTVDLSTDSCSHSLHICCNSMKPEAAKINTTKSTPSKVIEEMSVKKPISATSPTTTLPGVDVGKTGPITTTADEYKSTTVNCTCVPYYRCKDEKYKPNDGDYLIDIHIPVEDKCGSYLDVCCKNIIPESETSHSTINPVNAVEELPEGKPKSAVSDTVDQAVSSPDCSCVLNVGCPGRVNVSEEAAPTNDNEKCDFDLCCKSTQDQPTASVPRNISPHLQPYLASCGHRNLNKLLPIKSFQPSEDEALYAEFPWMVAVKYWKTESEEAYICGGSLIHPQVVLTGGHCVQKDNLFIRAGEWDMETENELHSVQDRNVSQVVVHEDFNSGSLANSIALLVLESPVDIKEDEGHIGIICLPQENENFDRREGCIATGWGQGVFEESAKLSPILKKIDLPIVPRDVCEETLQNSRLGPRFKLHSSLICAGGVSGHDTCTGDGGSPLVCPMKEDPKKYVQAGIVAWGIGCGSEKPATYTNVAGFLSWIYDQLEKHLKV